ncbi:MULTISPECIES: hypothetical protein [Paracoccus]|uniref:hypothetical protein n=1 Tax=Paracoccus TaxID=265 RepID=UPI001668EDAC|nr:MULTISPECIES: hypothetical protein [Paracoccus]
MVDWHAARKARAASGRSAARIRASGVVSLNNPISRLENLARRQQNHRRQHAKLQNSDDRKSADGLFSKPFVNHLRHFRGRIGNLSLTITTGFLALPPRDITRVLT